MKSKGLSFNYITLMLICQFLMPSIGVVARAMPDEYVENPTVEAVVNQKWLEYESATDTEKKNYELIPEKYIYESTEPEKIMSSFAASYSLKNQGVMSPLENQGSFGICWAFSANLSLESVLRRQDPNFNIQFSERQFDYATSINGIAEGFNPFVSYFRTLTTGAYHRTPFEAFLAGYAPVNSSDFNVQYLDTSKKSLAEIYPSDKMSYSVQEYIELPSIAVNANAEIREAWVAKIKSHIANHGALTVASIGTAAPYGGSCFYYGGSYILLNVDGSCREEDHNNGHMMTIIGWDDNVEYSYCRKVDANRHGYTDEDSDCASNGGTPVSGRGAFILQNSWTTDESSVYAYPLLAYTSYVDSLFGVTKASTKDWDNSYVISDSSDYETSLYSWSYKKNDDKSEDYIAFMRDPSSSEKLQRISFVARNNLVKNGDTTEAYISFDGQNYAPIGDITLSNGGGFSIVPDDEIVLTGSSFIIKLVSTSNYISNVSVFTNFTDQSTAKTFHPQSSAEITKDVTDKKSTIYYLPGFSRNIKNGTKLTYKLIAKNGADFSNYISASGNYVINNFANTTISISDDLPVGEYILTTLDSNTILNQTNYNNVLPDNIVELEPIDNQYFKLGFITTSELLSYFHINNLTVSVSEIKTGAEVAIKNSNGASLKTWQIAVAGDVNGDGKENIFDYIAIRKHIMETDIITAKVTALAADVNDDNKINIFDYIEIRKNIMERE